MLRLGLVIALVSSTAVAAGCSRGIRVRPVTPAAQAPVSAVVVELGPKIVGKKEKLLVNYRVMEEMGVALRGSTAPGGNAQLVATITHFRTGSWGPTVMRVVAKLIGPRNRMLARYEARSASAFGSRRSRIQKVAQQIVTQLVLQMRRQQPPPPPQPPPPQPPPR